MLDAAVRRMYDTVLPVPLDEALVVGDGGGDLPRLAAGATGSHTGIVLHAVLDDAAAADARPAVVREAYRLLAPGGVLAATATNRIAPARVTGGAGQPARRRQAPLTYWGYARLLRRAGFREITSYAVLPDYERPHWLVSTARVAAGHFYASLPAPGGRSGRRLLRGVLDALGARPYVEPSFLFVARRC